MTQPISTSQLTLNLEPSIVDRWSTLREYLEHRVGAQVKTAKQIAAEMDIAPSTLSKKLNEVDSNRFTVDNLEEYIQITGDVQAVIEYLATKFAPGGDAARKARAIARLESLANVLGRELEGLKQGNE
jgi:hypothetical protein